MRVLVTGAGGFAGGHLARRLAAAGLDVIAGTRGSPVEPPFDPVAARRFTVAPVRLEDPHTLPRPIDAIVHVAATSPAAGVTVDRMVADNVVATRNLIRHALETRVTAFVFFSSVSAFGKISVDTLSESVPSIDADAYGTTKLVGEQLLADVAGELPSVAFRLPAVIGRGSKRNWPSECLRKLKAGEPLSFFNPEAPFNNLVHEQDLSALTLSMLGKRLIGHDKIVVGASSCITVGEAVAILVKESRSASEVSSRLEPRNSFVIDWSKAARLYGFAPMTVQQALERIAEEGP